MIIKDEMGDELLRRKKIKSLVCGVELPKDYAYWFDGSVRVGSHNVRVAGIYKLTGGSYHSIGDPNDSLVADFRLLGEDLIEVVFWYKDSYDLIKPALLNSEMKFNIVKRAGISDRSPEFELTLGLFRARR